MLYNCIPSDLIVTSLALQLANVRHLAQSVALSLPITRNQHTKESRKGLRDLEDVRTKQEHKRVCEECFVLL